MCVRKSQFVRWLLVKNTPPLLVFFTNKRPRQGTLYRSLLVDVRKKNTNNDDWAGGKEHQHGEEHQQVVGEEHQQRRGNTNNGRGPRYPPTSTLQHFNTQPHFIAKN